MWISQVYEKYDAFLLYFKLNPFLLKVEPHYNLVSYHRRSISLRRQPSTSNLYAWFSLNYISSSLSLSCRVHFHQCNLGLFLFYWIWLCVQTFKGSLECIKVIRILCPCFIFRVVSMSHHEHLTYIVPN